MSAHDPTTELPNASLEMLALERGWVTAAQVDDCQSLHLTLLELDLPASMGELLVRKGYLTQSQCAELESALGDGGGIQIPGYQIVEKIAEGGMGTVYKARQISMDRLVGLKVLRKRFAAEADGRERFLREARAVAQLSHPNIVAGIDAGVAGGVYYFVMEFLDGQSIEQVLRQRGRLPWAEATAITLQMARALAHAADHQIVHRDVKPGNIMLMADGTAKLADLGLARADSVIDSSLTQSGMIVGSPAYLSPEQAAGDVVLDSRSDIFSLGLTYFEMIAGERAYQGNNPMSVMSALLLRDVPVDRLLALDAPGDVVAIISKMTRRDRQGRYADPKPLLEDLEALNDGRRPQHAYASDPIASSDSGGTAAVLPAMGSSTTLAAVGRRQLPLIGGLLVLLLIGYGMWTVAFRTPSPVSTMPMAAPTAAAQLSLTAAIAVAQKAYSAPVFQAELENDEYSVDLAVDGRTLNLSIDADDGEISEELMEDEDHSLDVQMTAVSLIDAVLAAEAESEGTAVHAEIRLLPGRSVIAVKFRHAQGNRWTIVDGSNGEVIEVADQPPPD